MGYHGAQPLTSTVSRYSLVKRISFLSWIQGLLCWRSGHEMLLSRGLPVPIHWLEKFSLSHLRTHFAQLGRTPSCMKKSSEAFRKAQKPGQNSTFKNLRYWSASTFPSMKNGPMHDTSGYNRYPSHNLRES